MLSRATCRVVCSIAVVVALHSSNACAAPLESLDLASLCAESDAVVLVEGFVSAGPTRPSPCVVKKSYSGPLEAGTPINVIPWSAQVSHPEARIRGRSGFTCVFFLKKQREGEFWGTALSGIRLIGEEKVFGLAPGGSGLYEAVPAASEALRPMPEDKPYDAAALEQDLAAAADRALRARKALQLPKNAQSVAHLEEILGEELQRVFPGASQRPAVSRSELVAKIWSSLLEKGEVEAMWVARARIPGGRFRSELDTALLERSPFEFIRGRIEDAPAPERAEMLAVLAASGFRAQNAVKPEVLRRLFEKMPSLSGGERFTAHAAVAELYRGLPLDPGDALLSRLIAAVGTGDSTALYHFGPVIVEREPALAVKVLPDRSSLFGLVTIEESTLKLVRGRVDLRRLPAGHSFGRPEIVIHRTGGTAVDIRRHALDELPGLLSQGKSGASSVSFSASFAWQPLASGSWRAFIEASWTGGASGTWRSGSTTFQVAP